MQTRTLRILLLSGWIIGCLISAGAIVKANAQDEDLYGKAKRDNNALIGIFYDLKQTQKRDRTGMDPMRYGWVFREFLQKNWDEAVLSRFFRCTRPLYCTQLYIPEISASRGPAAFGVEKLVKPSLWFVHYKGQVTPPKDGTYRFVGYGDDVLAVAINGKTVLVSCWIQGDWTWKPKVPHGAQAASGYLNYGDWIPLKKDTVVDMDVLIGECPGGACSTFLLYQRQGDTYKVDAGNNPILPIFQLAEFATKKVADSNLAPPFAPGTEIWHGIP